MIDPTRPLPRRAYVVAFTALVAVGVALIGALALQSPPALVDTAVVVEPRP